MTEDGTYGVQLDLLTQNYNKKLQDVVKTTETQAKLIEQKAKVNFSNYSPLSSMKSLSLDMQSSEIENYQTQVKNLLSDFKLGNIDTSQAKKTLENLLNDIKLTNDAFAKYTSTRIKINVDDSELSLLKNAGVNTQLIDNYVQATSRDLENATDNTKKLEKNLNSASNGAKILNQNTSSVNRNTSELGQSLERNMNKGVGSTRKLLFSLFSVHSAWSLISRASSNAISLNDGLNSRVNVLNAVLGNMVLPIVQRIVGYAEYGVIFVAKVVQFFTGFNALANITTSNLKNSVKQAKELTRTLSGLDEITNIGNYNKGSLASGIKNDLKALDDFYKKIEEVEQWMQNSGIYGFLDTVKAVLSPLWNNIVKPMIDYAKANPTVFTTLFEIFLGAKLLNGINNIIGNKSAGLTGMTSLLNGIKGIGVITIGFVVTSVINELNQVKNEVNGIQSRAEQARKTWLNSKPPLEDIFNTMKVNNQAGLEALKQGSVFWNDILGLSKKYLDNAELVVKNSELNLDKLKEINDYGELNKEQQIELLENLYNQVEVNDKIIEKLKQEGRDTTELENINIRYKEATGEIYDNLLNQGVAYDEIYKKIGIQEEKIKEIANADYEAEINVNAITVLAGTAIARIVNEKYEASINVKANTTEAKKGLTSFFKGVGSLGAGTLSLIGISSAAIGSAISKINSFDVGTNYVPNDQLAMVHKGEMIIPEKYNPSTSGINSGRDSAIISAIEHLTEVLEEKDMIVNITEDEIGQVASNYKSRRSRQLGRDVA